MWMKRPPAASQDVRTQTNIVMPWDLPVSTVSVMQTSLVLSASVILAGLVTAATKVCDQNSVLLDSHDQNSVLVASHEQTQYW